MITSFGKEMRKIRIDRGEVLKNTADHLGVSSSFVSAVESGRRNVPNDWIPKLTKIYQLTADEESRLYAAAQASVGSVKISLTQANQRQREAALVFARDFSTLSDDLAEQIISLFQGKK